MNFSPLCALSSSKHQETKSSSLSLPLADQSANNTRPSPPPRARAPSLSLRWPNRQETKSTKLLRPLADRSTKKPRAPRHLCCLPEAIKQFHNGHHVWLWSRAHGTYLYADDDVSSVSLQLGHASVHAAWAVHNGGSIWWSGQRSTLLLKKK